MLVYIAFTESIRFSSRLFKNLYIRNLTTVVRKPKFAVPTTSKRPLHTAKLWPAISRVSSVHLVQRPRTRNMSTNKDGELSQEARLADMNITANMQASYTSVNPVEIYRQHIGELLAPIVGIKAEEIIPRLQWTQTQDKGDLMLATPALRIKGKKPNEQAAEWGEKVGSFFRMIFCIALNFYITSFQSPTLWKSLWFLLVSYNSISNPCHSLRL